MEKLNIVPSKYIYSVSKMLLLNMEIVGRIDAKLIDKQWYIEPSDIEYSDFFYLINNSFSICDPLIEKYNKYSDIFFTTQNNVNQTFTNSNIKYINSEICSMVDYDNKKIYKKTTFFKYVDPIVILNFSLYSDTETTIVITCEWICDDKLILINSKPYEINKSKKSFNGLSIIEEVPAGKWNCNLYLGTQLLNSHNFVILDSKNYGETKPLFINTSV